MVTAGGEVPYSLAINVPMVAAGEAVLNSTVLEVGMARSTDMAAGLQRQ